MSLSAAAPPMSLLRRYWRDRALWTTIADVFAILTALALPWSTSLVAIFVPCWLGAVAWVMDWRAYGRLLKQPICYLPLALVGRFGMVPPLTRRTPPRAVCACAT